MGYKTIVCGVTGSLHSQKAALEAAIIASRAQTRLIYVYVVDVSFLRRGSSLISSGAVADSLHRIGEQFLNNGYPLTHTLLHKHFLKHTFPDILPYQFGLYIRSPMKAKYNAESSRLIIGSVSNRS